MISIIIPVYNSRRYLEECLASVLKQTYTDFEVLLVDDGSTDASAEWCAGVARSDSRIRFLSQPHQGASAARNTALAAANGEHVLFLDSDDTLHPRCLERMYRQMTARGATFAFCSYSSAPFEEDRLPDGHQAQQAEWDVLNGSEMLERFCRNNKVFGGIGGKLIARDAIGDLRFDVKLSLGEDTLFLYELLRTGITGVYTQAALYNYRAKRGTLSALRYTARGLGDVGSVCLQIWRREEECGRTDHARIWAGAYLNVIKKAMNHLPAGELRQWRAEVTQIRKSPYFRERPLRTRGAVFLAFYCHPVYRAIKISYRFLRRGKKGQNDKDI